MDNTVEKWIKHFESLDTILIKNEDDLHTLLRWRDANKDIVREFNPVIDEAIIRYGNHVQMHFVRKGRMVRFRIADAKARLLNFDAEWTNEGVKVNNIMNAWHGFNGQNAVQDAITIYSSIMAYMANHTEYVEQTTQRKSVTKKAKHGKKGKRVVKMGKTVYTVSVPRETLNKRKDIQRHTEQWTVKGHWRQLKSGKRIWINNYIKGKKDGQREPKIYKL